MVKKDRLVPGPAPPPGGAPAPSHSPPQKLSSRRRHRTLLPVVLLLGAAGAAAYALLRHQATRLPEVFASAVVVSALEVDWSATGYVTARTARISPPQAARVTAVLVREGDQVLPGQVLARLAGDKQQADAEGYREAAGASRAEEDAARAALRQAAQLVSDRVAESSAGVEAARARVAQARATVVREKRVAEANAGAATADAEGATQQLAELRNGPRPQEIIQAEAAAADAEAVRRRAEIEQVRQLRLYREGAVARQAVDDSEVARARAEAQVKRTRAALDLLRQGTRPEAIAAAEARLQAAWQRLAAAQAQLAGTDVLEQDLEERKAGLRQAEAVLAQARSARRELDTLRARLAVAEHRTAQAVAGLRGARAELLERTLTAPFAGYVGRRLADPGDLAVPGQPLFSIVEADRAWIEAEADEEDLAQVELGQPVSITAPSYPGRVFPGKVTRIGAEAIPQIEQTRTSARVVRIRVSLDLLPASRRSLFKPGLEVDVAGRTVLAKRALLVPNDVVRMDSGGPYVLAAEGDRLVRKRIRTGQPSGRMTQVLSGLRESDRVIVSPVEGLGEGTRVVVRSAP